MSEQLLTIFNVCLLVLIYLFFLRVLRAVWSEIGGRSAVPVPGPAPAARRQRAVSADESAHRAAQLIVREPASHAGLTFTLVDEISMGRAAGCHITLDDTFVSQIHARVFRSEGQFMVEDMGSTNGTYLNRTRVGAPMVMHAGDLVQVGNTVLELV